MMKLTVILDYIYVLRLGEVKNEGKWKSLEKKMVCESFVPMMSGHMAAHAAIYWPHMIREGVYRLDIWLHMQPLGLYNPQ